MVPADVAGGTDLGPLDAVRRPASAAGLDRKRPRAWTRPTRLSVQISTNALKSKFGQRPAD